MIEPSKLAIPPLWMECTMPKKLNPAVLSMVKMALLIAGGSLGTYLATSVPEVYAAICTGGV